MKALPTEVTLHLYEFLVMVWAELPEFSWYKFPVPWIRRHRTLSLNISKLCVLALRCGGSPGMNYGIAIMQCAFCDVSCEVREVHSYRNGKCYSDVISHNWSMMSLLELLEHLNDSDDDCFLLLLENSARIELTVLTRAPHHNPKATQGTS